MLEFGELIEMAGFPPGVVNIITGHGDPCGKELTSHPRSSCFIYRWSKISSKYN